MNRERAKELLPIIQAFAEGKSIQYKDAGDTEWHDNEPLRGIGFYDISEYRIKPEPREFWLVAAKSGSMSMTDHHPTKEAAENHMYEEMELTDELWEVIKVREVIE